MFSCPLRFLGHQQFGKLVKLLCKSLLCFLCVVNQGCTIATEHLPHLFNRFYRVDAARTGAIRNHGLGLAIVAAIARMHGGRTVAESHDGVTSIGLVVPAASSFVESC